MCPTSNVQTGAVASIKEHPIGLLRELLFRVTVNTDNRLMSGVTLSSEFHPLAEAFGYGWGDIEWLTINAMKSAFARLRRAAAPHQHGHQARLRHRPRGERRGGPGQHAWRAPAGVIAKNHPERVQWFLSPFSPATKR